MFPDLDGDFQRQAGVRILREAGHAKLTPGGRWIDAGLTLREDCQERRHGHGHGGWRRRQLPKSGLGFCAPSILLETMRKTPGQTFPLEFCALLEVREAPFRQAFGEGLTRKIE
eukprot:6190798-Pleurochrysis_carterae.AAC.1